MTASRFWVQNVRGFFEYFSANLSRLFLSSASSKIFSVRGPNFSPRSLKRRAMVRVDAGLVGQRRGWCGKGQRVPGKPESLRRNPSAGVHAGNPPGVNYHPPLSESDRGGLVLDT